MIEGCCSSLAEQKIEFALGNLPPCHADPALLRQVYANLIGDSVKYTAPVKNARIEIGSRLDNQQITYFVRDNGVGFDIQTPRSSSVYSSSLRAVDPAILSCVYNGFIIRDVTRFRYTKRVNSLEGEKDENQNIFE